MYDKRIVCDLDDTISFTVNRDWEGAIPDNLVIKKLNQFYDLGWEILILTARGQLSCGGDYTKADKKYRPQIEEWLKKHGVKYTELSFNKPLGTYYIDDKGLRPDEFVSLEHTELHGMSGAYIVKQGDVVNKTADNSHSAIAWYDIASKLVNTPKIHKLIGKTITMQYIKPTGEVNLENLCDTLEEFKNIPSYRVDFDTYIDRVKNHWYGNWPDQETDWNWLNSISDICNENHSFCHGDASIDNFINNRNKIYMIDPIHEEKLWSSWLLDISKLLMSLKRFNRPDDYLYVKERYKEYPLRTLELTWWIRFYKYTDNQSLCLERIEELMI